MQVITYGILDLEDEVHSIWVIWTSNLQECKGNFIFWSQAERAGSMDFHPGSEGGVPRAGLNPGQMWFSPGPSEGSVQRPSLVVAATC